jgi:hypothetical protein
MDQKVIISVFCVKRKSKLFISLASCEEGRFDVLLLFNNIQHVEVSWQLHAGLPFWEHLSTSVCITIYTAKELAGNRGKEHKVFENCYGFCGKFNLS